jgi:hypothetical protein
VDSRPRDPDFEITVLTGMADSLELSNELRHVKAALLYADRVRLVSPTVAMLELFATIADGSDSQLIERLMAISMPADFPHGADLIEGLHRKHGRQRNPQQIAFDWRMRSMAASQRNAFEQYAEQLRSQPEVAELYRARDAGVVQLTNQIDHRLVEERVGTLRRADGADHTLQRV